VTEGGLIMNDTIAIEGGHFETPD